MDIHDLIYTTNSKKIDDLLPITKVITDEDVKFYRKKQYNTQPLDVFKKFFPDLPDSIIDHLYYDPSSFNSLLYYNQEEMVFFDTNIYVAGGGFNYLMLNQVSAPDMFEKRKQHFKKYYDREDYALAFSFAPEAYQVEFTIKSLLQIPEKYRYNSFLDIYTSSDFGSFSVTPETIRIILNSKTPSQKGRTTRALNKLTDSDTIHIYRGIGDKSNKEGISYTLSHDVARFFAFRHSTKADSVEILSADVKKKDIIEYITDRNEAEILTYPEKIFNVNTEVYNGVHPLLYEKDYLLPIYTDQKKRFEQVYKTLDLAFDSKDHTVDHMLRVLFLCIILADHYKLKKALRPTLYNAAMFHDIGRYTDFEDTKHGAESYKLLSEANNSFKNNKLLENLITYHCINDDQAFAFKDDNEKLMYQILKDADALDRQRLGLRALNRDYLRLDYSHELLFVAFQLETFKM